MNLSFTPYILYFKRPFKIAHGTRSSTPIIITQIECDGKIGFGEASMPPYLGETHQSGIEFLNKAIPVIAQFKNPSEIESILKVIDDIAINNTAAKASIDIALFDLAGKLVNSPTWKNFGGDKTNTPYTTYTIGIDEPEIIKEKITEGNQFKYYKVKLNGTNDKLIIDTIRKITDKPIAIDVNQGWKKKEMALEMINWLSEKNVLFIEQPLPKENIDDARWLYEKSPLLLFADESIKRYEDLDKVKDCFHGINIKLMKSTGMFEAKRMIEKAKELKLKILVGCMSETSCGISAAAQLTPFVDYADLDGSLLIKNNLFDGITFREGKIILNEMPGNGIIWKGN